MKQHPAIRGDTTQEDSPIQAIRQLTSILEVREQEVEEEEEEVEEDEVEDDINNTLRNILLRLRKQVSLKCN